MILSGWLKKLSRDFTILFVAVGLGASWSLAQGIQDADEVGNWPAPLLWTPAPARVQGGVHTEAAATVTAPLPFIAMTPCRLADTRGNGFTGAYGPPSLRRPTRTADSRSPGTVRHPGVRGGGVLQFRRG